MLIKSNLLVILSAFGLLSSIFVVWSKNPIFSVLFLIFSFFNVAAILFLFNFEFLPIAFLIIYVGAVAVLFLFVLMMLSIKLAEMLETYNNVVPIGLLFVVFFIYQLLFLLRFEFASIELLDSASSVFLLDFLNVVTVKTEFFNLSGSLPNIKIIAFALFTEHLFHFLIAGVVLLLAMLAAIVLTLEKNFVSKTQNVYTQILKDFNFAIVSAH
jgi:NADH:ubiquinone oxidoreductase subunit 6 (subunit J)